VALCCGGMARNVEDVLVAIRRAGLSRSEAAYLRKQAVLAAVGSGPCGEGLGAATPQPSVALLAVEEVLDVIATQTGLATRPGIGEAKRFLRGLGPDGPALAKRFGKLTSVRNAAAHPDIGLVSAIRRGCVAEVGGDQACIDDMSVAGLDVMDWYSGQACCAAAGLDGEAAGDAAEVQPRRMYTEHELCMALTALESRLVRQRPLQQAAVEAASGLPCSSGPALGIVDMPGQALEGDAAGGSTLVMQGSLEPCMVGSGGLADGGHLMESDGKQCENIVLVTAGVRAARGGSATARKEFGEGGFLNFPAAEDVVEDGGSYNSNIDSDSDSHCAISWVWGPPAAAPPPPPVSPTCWASHEEIPEGNGVGSVAGGFRVIAGTATGAEVVMAAPRRKHRAGRKRQTWARQARKAEAAAQREAQRGRPTERTPEVVVTVDPGPGGRS